jgi:hypothetical protein
MSVIKKVIQNVIQNVISKAVQNALDIIDLVLTDNARAALY